MDPLLARTIYPRFWKGVKKNHISVEPKFYPLVFDAETIHGRPFALGFHNGNCLSISYGLYKDHLRWLLDQLGMVDAGRSTIILAGHVVRFDLQVLLWPILNPLCSKRSIPAPRHSHFSMLEPKCEIEIYWDRPTFGTIKIRGKTIHIIDTYAFFTMSLDKALKAINSKHRKLGKPKGLGKRLIPAAELRPYLSGDLNGAFDLLLQIIKFHKEYGVKLCVSSPMMAGKIFRHHFLIKDFVSLPQKLLTPALLSYHGGKNSFPGKPGWYLDCYDLDINSAYAEAMRQLPDFQHGRWKYGRGKDFVCSFPHGIYLYKGRIKRCRWGLLFDHGFRKIFGYNEGIWCTGYELLEGWRSGELQDYTLGGWGFAQNRKAGISPFERYVDDFYEKKSNATDPGWRVFYKHMLTDLYGKFIARTEDDNGNMVAGSMFDPAIASLITGFVRAKIHRLEHKYKAIHTATDGFITQRRPLAGDISDSIGSLKLGVFGDVAILRNKLYLHYSKETGKLGKCGLHGFELGPKKLMNLWKTGKRKYTVEHLVGWKEAWHIGLPPGMPIEKEKELRI